MPEAVVSKISQDHLAEMVAHPGHGPTSPQWSGWSTLQIKYGLGKNRSDDGRGYPASVRIEAARSAGYTTNIATPAANSATAVIATTVHPKRELGWPCISFLSEATTRIPTRSKGANNPLMMAVQ